MLKRQHIEYELGKLKTKIYNIEQEIFKTFTEIQEDINDLNKFVRSTYGLNTKCDKMSHNLYYEDTEKPIKPKPVHEEYKEDLEEYLQKFDKPIDLSKATALTLKALKKAKKEQDKIKGAKK